MRNNIAAITAAEIRSTGAAAVARGDSEREVALALMRAARQGFMAPTEDEAFLASVSALAEALPDRKDTIMAEARTIGDRSKILNALVNGVPVDFDSVQIAEPPEDALGLVTLWHESAVV
jgi:hypothetical protein